MTVDTIITKISKDDKATVVSVLFTDNLTFKKMEDFRLESFTLEGFKAQIRSRLAGFVQVDDAFKTLSEGAFDPTATVAVSPPRPDPTPEELARSAYATNVRKLGQMNRAIAAGVKTVADKDYTDVQAQLKSGFIDSYIDLF